MRSPLVFIFSGSKAPGRRKYVVRLWGDGVSGDVNGFGSLPRPRFSPRVMHGRACPCEALISGSSDPKAILSGPLVNTVIYPADRFDQHQGDAAADGLSACLCV
jgi:hypothetical protein